MNKLIYTKKQIGDIVALLEGLSVTGIRNSQIINNIAMIINNPDNMITREGDTDGD